MILIDDILKNKDLIDSVMVIQAIKDAILRRN